ncbi:MAG: sulfatase, partial [Gemmatimonadota bacterium]|nr:sulfatase [Gemmatimonadota bacterium]
MIRDNNLSRKVAMSSMSRRLFIERLGRTTAAALAAGPLVQAGCSKVPEEKPLESRPGKPNFVILFADDMGYGDWNRGGNPTIRTPCLNRMADEGVQLTQFYTANPVCSPSRSALLTGRNPIRTGVLHVFFPGNGRGMSLDEITLAEALKPMGYKSACIGKWHLGSTYDYRPLRQGFDYYYGLLYSNDMYRPDIWRNDERIESPSDQTTLTKRYTEEAVGFIERSKDEPFLLYVPYTMPHIPLFASEKFLDTSRRGLYGDVIEEIDWSVGRINDTLDRLGLSENTLVMFTSDNGPWMIMNERGGTAGLLRGAKGDTWEGGMREPFVARWPGRLPAGVVSAGVASVLDFLPTCVELAGGRAPSDRPIDGIDMMPTLEGISEPERTI